jgi:hypothetical protein
MTTTNSFLRYGLFAVSTCVLVPSLLCAQGGSGRAPATSSSAAPPSQGADTSAAPKAHDDSFVIGNDDVLAINVWKEKNLMTDCNKASGFPPSKFAPARKSAQIISRQ